MSRSLSRGGRVDPLRRLRQLLESVAGPVMLGERALLRRVLNDASRSCIVAFHGLAGSRLCFLAAALLRRCDIDGHFGRLLFGLDRIKLSVALLAHRRVTVGEALREAVRRTLPLNVAVTDGEIAPSGLVHFAVAHVRLARSSRAAHGIFAHCWSFLVLEDAAHSRVEVLPEGLRARLVLPLHIEPLLLIFAVLLVVDVGGELLARDVVRDFAHAYPLRCLVRRAHVQG